MVLREAQDDARNDFGLKTSGEILRFIANGGLEQLEFINSKPWEKNPDPSRKIIVDGYEFVSLMKRGYVAFMFNEITDYWTVKSFHISDNACMPFVDAFRKAGLLPGGDHE
ncbi:MAG: hypothetical protein ABFC84_03480 [Veillonellales bacterium]